jgi:tetratricopeptide (TPR) repeat protein
MTKRYLQATFTALFLMVGASANTAAADVRPLLQRANAIEWKDLGNIDVVRRHLEMFYTAAQRDPDNLEAHLRGAQFAFYAWRLEKEQSERLRYAQLCLRLGTRAAEIDPEHPGGWYWKGSSLAMIGLVQGVLNSLQLVPTGLRHFERMKQLDGGYLDGGGIASLARMYAVLPGFPLSVGNRNRGKEMLLDGYERFPTNSYFPLYLADIAWDEGETDAALAYAKKVLEMRPADEMNAFRLLVNQRAARTLIELVESGTPRDRWHDVLQD